MSKSVEDRYIDLLKKTLCYRVYDQPPVPMDMYWADRGFIKRGLRRVISPLLRNFGAQVAFKVRYPEEDIEKGKIWPVAAHSMIGSQRMDNLDQCVRTVVRENIPGDLIETGVWRGGACILMRGILAALGDNSRKVYVADSFEGLPKPDEKAYPADAGDRHHEFSSYLGVSRQQVEENFRRYGLLDDNVVFLQGWFKDTLPGLAAKQFAVIRLDGDMYESTMDALTPLYPKLSPGGFCIIDDFHLENCRAAVHDYRKANGIEDELLPIDGQSMYWRKAR